MGAPKPLDRRAIEDKALSYLDRFDASASRLRRMLEQFVRRRAKDLGVDAAPFMDVIHELLHRYQASGVVDDRRYATSMARTLAERGASRQAIRTKLLGRGVQAEIIHAVVGELGQEVGTELDAARTLVRKRGLGHCRPAAERQPNFRRDWGVLARAGFAFDIAKIALNVEGVSDEDDVF